MGATQDPTKPNGACVCFPQMSSEGVGGSKLAFLGHVWGHSVDHFERFIKYTKGMVGLFECSKVNALTK